MWIKFLLSVLTKSVLSRRLVLRLCTVQWRSGNNGCKTCCNIQHTVKQFIASIIYQLWCHWPIIQSGWQSTPHDTIDLISVVRSGESPPGGCGVCQSVTQVVQPHVTESPFKQATAQPCPSNSKVFMAKNENPIPRASMCTEKHLNGVRVIHH